MLRIYVVNETYIKSLRQTDRRLSDPKYDEEFGRKYVGVVLKINSFYYFAPLTSSIWQIKTVNGKKVEVLDKKGDKILKKNFTDILIKNRNGEYKAALKINNMFPIPKLSDDYATLFNYEELKQSKNERERFYGSLVEDEFNYINSPEVKEKIESLASNFYRDYRFNPLLKKLCCDFKLLEQKALEYISKEKSSLEKDEPEVEEDEVEFE